MVALRRSTAIWATLLAIGVQAAADDSVVAHWSFDETTGTQCLDSGTDEYTARPLRGADACVPAHGLFGGAMRFAGNHMLAVQKSMPTDELEQISLSVWVRPTEMSGYREIFRKEDGDRRVLFSFQSDGRILALGLNVNGYVECDATIRPEITTDGQWHHCAATFDGETMRVFLDGGEVGSLKRAGRITAGGTAPGCIGSSSGGECFQGEMDELAIWSRALSEQEIAQQYRKGLERILSQSETLRTAIQDVYAAEATFAETLIGVRRRLAQRAAALDGPAARFLATMIQTDFPEDSRRFEQSLGASPGEYMTAYGDQFHTNRIASLVGMMMEYCPLTDQQQAGLSEEERTEWRVRKELAQRFDALLAGGEATRFSPQWIEIALAAAQKIDARPTLREAVAPFVKAQTPETRDLSDQEAQEQLQRDWLHQAGGNPTIQRIHQEIGWGRELAQRIENEHPGIDVSQELTELTELQRQMDGKTGSDQTLYFAVRRAKRRIQFASAAIDFDSVLLVDTPYPQGNEWPHETRHRLGYMAVPGGRLVVLEGLSPAGHVRQLAPQSPLHGSFWRPDLSWDARRVLFSFKPANEKAFHLYEIDIDGSGLRQITSGMFDDLDPVYLPDGQHAAFSTTRSHTYVRCMPPTNAFPLARCRLDGTNIHFISTNNEPDYLPSVMNDGRIIYTRWEYTDKPLWRAQSLWTVNPDGTQVNTFWGNQSVWPDLMKDARAIPGSRRVMFTGSAHHNWFAGSIGIVDPDQGANFPHGLTKVTADQAWPESGNGPVDPVETDRYHASGSYEGYYSPYPLSETEFLTSARRNGKFVLYLMDVDGNRELIYEGVHQALHAQPVRERPLPPVVPERSPRGNQYVGPNPAQGVVYSANVYFGAPDILRGKAKYLRILHIEPKTYTYWDHRPALSTGPVVSTVQSEGVKRVIGTAPIESDGSVSFKAPAVKSLHFQLLDENYRALQTMRSFVGVMPNEQRGCLGCHEQHSKTPQSDISNTIASRREPSEITPPPWGDETISYPRFVRSVLDQYCTECHSGDGQGAKSVDFTPRPGALGFDETYHLLIGRPSWGKAYVPPPEPPPGFGIANILMVEAYDQRDPQAYRTPKPMTTMSYRSKLIQLAANGDHYGVIADPVSLRRLAAWIDAMGPYRGDEEIREIQDPDFQGIDWLSIRPRIHTAPRVPRVGALDDYDYAPPVK